MRKKKQLFVKIFIAVKPISPQEKVFLVDFESAGAGTCVTIDYADGVINSYGDEEYCTTVFATGSDVVYVPNTAMSPFPIVIKHTYQSVLKKEASFLKV